MRYKRVKCNRGADSVSKLFRFNDTIKTVRYERHINIIFMF